MFGTFEELTGWFTSRTRKADMDSVLQYLNACVEEETEYLLEGELRRMERSRRSSKLLRQCEAEAQEQYTEDVTSMLESDAPMGHWTVISYRRKPKAWAIAGAIKERMKKENDW